MNLLTSLVPGRLYQIKANHNAVFSLLTQDHFEQASKLEGTHIYSKLFNYLMTWEDHNVTLKGLEVFVVLGYEVYCDLAFIHAISPKHGQLFFVGDYFENQEVAVLLFKYIEEAVEK